MSSNISYVKFDQNGIIGPILTMLYQPDQDKLGPVSETIEANYFRLKGVRLKHRERFCEDMRKCMQRAVKDRLQKMMDANFIKGMYPLRARCFCEPSSPFLNNIQKIAIPYLFEKAQKYIPNMETNCPKKVSGFLARLLEGCFPTQQIVNTLLLIEIFNQNPEFKDKVENLAVLLNNELYNKKITERELTIIIDGIRGRSLEYLNDTSDGLVVKEIVEKYHTAGALIDDSMLRHEAKLSVCHLLEDYFIPLHFPPQPQYGTDELKTEHSTLL